MAGRKAITVTIALLLTTAILFAVAMSAFVFTQKTQRAAQGTAEVATSNLLQRWATCGKLESYVYNVVDNNATAVLRNCGFRPIDLSRMQALIKTGTGEGCKFLLTSSNCANCAGRLGVGSYVALKINGSAVQCETGGAQIIKLSEIMSHNVGASTDILMSDRDGTFSAAQTFQPTTIVDCKPTLDDPGDQCDDTSNSFDYVLTNLGNAADVITISAANSSNGGVINDIYSGACGGVSALPAGSMQKSQFSPSSGDTQLSFLLAPKQQEEFCVNVTVNCGVAPNIKNFVVTATSGNCGLVKFIDPFAVSCNCTIG